MKITKFDITGIGNACMDIVADCDMDFMARHNVHKSHCIYVDLPSLQKMKSELVNPKLIAGGSAANTVYVFQCLGGNTAFLGKIAEDIEGRTFETSMTSIGIETALSVSKEAETGSTQVVCLTTPDGDRSFVTYQGVAEDIAPEDMNYDIITASSIAYFDGYTMYSPYAMETFLKAAQIAKENGHLSVFNPGDLSIVERYKSDVDNLVKEVDIVICNLTEARAIFDIETLQDVADKLPSMKKTGVVTDGARGAVVFHEGKVHFLPAPPRPDGYIDTNGAGDHFAAGFLYGLTHDFTLPQMAKLAELCALDCLSHPGARPLGTLKHLIDMVD